MSALRTNYLGLDLEHPVIAAASPLSRTLDGIRRLEDSGSAAIVLFSLFEEQIRREHADAYPELIRRAKEAVQVPIIGSLNGATDEGWTSFARVIEEAGADALELNIFDVPSEPSISGAAVEQRYVDVAVAVRSATRLPLAVKMGPYFSSVPDMARRLIVAGADGLVLFNRFYQPDIDLDLQSLALRLELSARQEIRLPLLWIGTLYGRLPADLAATSGVETTGEIVKYLLAGADVVMTASSLLRHGPEHMLTLVRGLRSWLERHGYDSVAQIRGRLSRQAQGRPEAYERLNYVRMLEEYRVYVK